MLWENVCGKIFCVVCDERHALQEAKCKIHYRERFYCTLCANFQCVYHSRQHIAKKNDMKS